MICRSLWFGLILGIGFFLPGATGNALQEQEIICTIDLVDFNVKLSTGAEKEKPAWGEGKGDMTVTLKNSVTSSATLNKYAADITLSKIIPGVPDPGLVRLFVTGSRRDVPGPVAVTLISTNTLTEAEVKAFFKSSKPVKDAGVEVDLLTPMTVGFIALWQCRELVPLKEGRRRAEGGPGTPQATIRVGNKGGVVIHVNAGNTEVCTNIDFPATQAELDDLFPENP